MKEKCKKNWENIGINYAHLHALQLKGPVQKFQNCYPPVLLLFFFKSGYASSNIQMRQLLSFSGFSVVVINAFLIKKHIATLLLEQDQQPDHRSRASNDVCHGALNLES